MTLRTVTDGRVLRIHLEAPRRKNALSKQMLGQIVEVLGSVDPKVSGVVLTGTASVFSAGADFNDLYGDARDIAYDDDVAAVTSAIRAVRCPVIAAIEGPCMGAAVDVAFACDARVAGAGAFMQVPATKLGILYNPAAVDQWARDFGAPLVRDLLLLGRRVTSEQALAWGVVNSVVDATTACDVAQSMIPVWAQPAAVGATKAMLNAMTADSFDADVWQAKRRRLLESPDRTDALAAVRGGRKADAATKKVIITGDATDEQ